MSLGYPLNSLLLAVLGIILIVVGIIALNIIYCVSKYNEKKTEQQFVVINPMSQEVDDPKEKENNDPINIVTQ